MPAFDHAPDDMMHGTTLPGGTEIASYATHAEAQAAVDYLSEHDFDIRDVTIVGVEPHLVEHITGRLTPTRVALSGATNGLLWGAFFGLMMSFLNESLPGNGWIAVGLAVGATMGMLLALVSYMMRGGKRDFVSHTHVIAVRYAILAERDASKAFDLLQKTPGNQRRPNRVRPRTERPTHNGPTEYGSRPDEQPRFGVRLATTDEAAAAQSADTPPLGAPADTPALGGPADTPADVAEPKGNGTSVDEGAAGEAAGATDAAAGATDSADDAAGAAGASDDAQPAVPTDARPVDNPYAPPKD